MDYKISNSNLFLTDKWGNTGQRVAESVSYVTFSDELKLFVVTKLNGVVETRDVNGNFIRRIAENAVEARYTGSEFNIRRKDGKNEKRDKVGNFIRLF